MNQVPHPPYDPTKNAMRRAPWGQRVDKELKKLLSASMVQEVQWFRMRTIAAGFGVLLTLNPKP